MTRRRTTRDERGVAATIVLFPLFAGLVFMLVQAVFWQHDRQMAAAAADRASIAVAMYGSSAAEAEAVAIKQMASAGLTDISVSISRSATTTIVEVSGRAPGLITGTSVTVTARAVAPSEGYRSP